MGGYSRTVLAYVGATLVLAGVVLGLTVQAEVPAVSPSWPVLGVLAALAAAAHLYPVQSARRDVLFVLADAFLFAGVLLLPAWQVTVLCALALLPETVRRGRRPAAWVQYCFNLAQSALAALAAWHLTARTGAAALGSPADMAWLLAAILLFAGVQALLVRGITAVERKVAFFKVTAMSLRDYVADCMQPLLGALLVGLWQARPWLLALAFLPVAFVYRAVRNVHLVSAAEFEPKTGLYHMGAFQRRAQDELRRCRAIRRPVSLLFVDLDHLRRINNRHGHIAGDMAIRHVAGHLVRVMPRTAVSARFGGEEFVVLLPGVDREEACHLAERVREAAGGSPCLLRPGTEEKITVSIGVAGSPADEGELKELLDLADKAAYRAKHLGRNRVCLYGEGVGLAPRPESGVTLT